MTTTSRNAGRRTKPWLNKPSTLIAASCSIGDRVIRDKVRAPQARRDTDPAARRNLHLTLYSLPRGRPPLEKIAHL